MNDTKMIETIMSCVYVHRQCRIPDVNYDIINKSYMTCIYIGLYRDRNSRMVCMHVLGLFSSRIRVVDIGETIGT